MQPKIPKLKSRYIPVHSNAYVINSNIHWWKTHSPFVYPNVLINLISCSKEEIDKIRDDMDEELFLLVDSGGFQVISGNCNLDWESSLLKQIELEASKIFAFDKPPVKPKFEGSLNQFTYMNEEETKEIIKDNFDVALKQSEYLKEKYPEDFKRFCYILHGKNLEQINYNLELFKERFGSVDKYSEYFPGGIVYAAKSPDLLMITISARHAYENFVKKGIYVHFLGLGSFNRILILIRNEITTFDSSSMLQATRINNFINPANPTKFFQVGGHDLSGITKQFCTCPVCQNVDYNKLVEEEQFQMVGRHGIAHNLWYLLSVNVFLDALPKEKYTEMVLENFKVNEDVKQSLEFCDYADKNGFEVACEKYKPYLKKDETKQNTLF